MTTEPGATPTQYFTYVNGAEYGPYTVEQLQQYAGSGNITADSHVRVDGGDWVTASALPELAGAFPAPAAAPYPTAPAYGAAPAYAAAPGYAGQFSDKEWLPTVLISFFLGGLGVDRFYLGYTGLGIAKLLTCGGCGVWSLIDFIMIIMDKIPDAQGRPLRKS
ncbi:MAG: NINE protein [Aeromicrobium sp.]|uniref:NINE protein n=1 Tax=Aeromicrobium sp. TaxID=1871063 RepID=UPI0039E45C5F